jgi:hypothetical protein
VTRGNHSHVYLPFPSAPQTGDDASAEINQRTATPENDGIEIECQESSDERKANLQVEIDRVGTASKRIVGSEEVGYAFVD